MLKPAASTPGAITIGFATKTIFLEKEGAVESVETIELVKPGQLLAFLNPAADTKSPTPEQQKPPAKQVILTPGNHTQLSARGDSLLAIVAGYPQITKTTNANEETLTISIRPLVTISPDQMEASLTLYPPLPKTNPLTVEELTSLLKQAGIRHGMNEEILRDCLEQSRTEQHIITDALIASGSLPINGLDAHIRFEIEIGSIPGKIMGDGKIDFHERRMFIAVRKGQLLATKVPATIGTPGATVTGQPIPQKPGADLTVNVVDNASYNEESGEVHATKPGILDRKSVV